MRALAIPSLRWRLVAVMCLAYVVVSAATEFVNYTQQKQNLQSQLAKRARVDAHILAIGAIVPVSSQNRNGLQILRTFVTSLTNANDVSYAVVFGTNGCPLFHTVQGPTLPCFHQLYGIRRGVVMTSNGDVQDTELIADEGGVYGVARIVLSGSSVQNALQDTLKNDLILRGVGLLVFLFLSLLIARFILGPLSVLARASDAIRHGRLNTRVPPQGHTELAIVAGAFNEMADALEQRIDHLSFLASAAPVLPSVFRDNGDSAPTLHEFCVQLKTEGTALLPRGTNRGEQALWYDRAADAPEWRSAALAVARHAGSPMASVYQNWEVMAVPVLGDTVFVTARRAGHNFSREEQQVVTNFAYQLGVAADNARLFDSQQEALQVKDQFLSIVSHELRTPVTTIKGYAQMLRRKLADDPEDLRFAVNIDVQVTRLARLVDDLLDVTRFSRGQFEIKRSPMDIRLLLEDVVSRFRIVAPRHHFHLELDSGTFEGMWDRDRLEQVLNNLIGNAVKYSNDGGTIVVATSHEGNDLKVSVRDQGMGIPEQDLERLFERFFRGSAEGSAVKGLGLGLYVTHRIVEAHGGSVDVRSEVNQGSEFSFTLPQAPVPTAPRGERANR